MVKPFIYAGIIGNGRILATLGSTGELHRLFWPDIDLSQHINVTWAALLSPAFGNKGIRLDDDEVWDYSQEYINDAAVLQTECKDRYNRFLVRCLDFVVPERDILVRYYEIHNTSGNPAPVVFLYYTSMFIDESRLYNANYFDDHIDTLFHYRRDIWLAVAGSAVPSSYQSGIGSEDALYGNLNGNKVVMASDGCQAWDLGVIEPGQSKTVAVFIAAGHSREEASENIFHARRRSWDSLFKETAAFWELYLKQAYLPVGASEGIQELIKRSVMVCRLLMNRRTGGIIAAPEFDELCACCGGYAYVWVRDAVIIAHAMLKAGYADYARAFYRWTARFQLPDGSWPQRQYTNGKLAPRWGDQIDETGAALWGISRFYRETRDTGLIEEMWPTVEKAAGFLVSALNGETGLPGMSWDLWEERFGEHVYSSAAVYAGLKGAGQIAKALGHTDKAGEWLEISMALKDKITGYFWDDRLNRFIRSGWINVNRHVYEERRMAGRPAREVTGPRAHTAHQVFGDEAADASLLGLTVPYGVLAATDARMQSTVKYLTDELTTEMGGVKRYDYDNYRGGNPWVLTTLWLGMFYGAAGAWQKAKAALEWAVKHRTELGFLPEQVDCRTGKPAWVVPLAWSHAMFILLVVMMADAEQL